MNNLLKMDIHAVAVAPAQPKISHVGGKTVFFALSHHGQRDKRRPLVTLL